MYFVAFLGYDGWVAVDDAVMMWRMGGGMVLKMAGDGGGRVALAGCDRVMGCVDGGFWVFCKDIERCYLFVVVYIA